MANKINPFVYNGLKMEMFTNALFGSVRCVEIDGNPWFVGSDVAKCLGYRNPKEAIQDHVFPEYKAGLVANRYGTSGGNPNMIIISEPGLYQLIFSSKLSAAREFQKWVYSEVLPTMRKIGFSTSIDMLTRKVEELQDEVNVLYTENNKLDLYNGILEKGSIFSLNKFLESGE